MGKSYLIYMTEMFKSIKEFIKPEKKFSLENWIETEFKKDYDDQVRILNKLGLLELLPGKEEMGILGIDGKEYPLPTKEAIIAEIMKDKEKYETKMKQGFIQIQLTPFASPLEKLIETMKQQILRHEKAGKLFATKENLSDPDKKIPLNKDNPFDVSDNWIEPNAPQGKRGADVTGKCVYYPTLLKKEGHGGKTKDEMLKQQISNDDVFAGWSVILLEKNPNLPREGRGKTVEGREQIESNKTLEQYFNLLKTVRQYANEQGLTLEDWIIQFLTYLEKTNQVIDDYMGKGCICNLLASFNRFSGDFGSGFWNQYRKQALLMRGNPLSKRDDVGFRSAVRIGERKN